MRGMLFDLPFQPVDGADAEANLPGHFADADALGQLSACALDLVRFGTRAAQLRAHNAPLARSLIARWRSTCSELKGRRAHPPRLGGRVRNRGVTRRGGTSSGSGRGDRV